ncbi:hypothetical protein U3653_27740 [Nocardia sp. CDC186]|uniref:Molecular chaperone n=1 Tax=Nocardia implantans TaxID=3108168 RepID=A0ABU6B252_9NOCA|nr:MULTISPECIES: hypothetical protein [unclassified Nocardia]MBF6195792.1 hypothetical protein [Nocardia beijingensis]MEA3531672.1 hypothetical protein [Nocardia sp. CDC192]MEB3513837.1 hypothetical protein [Nocardia sp. CDC186]
MRATVGISAEQAVVRGVMIASTARRGTRPAVLGEIEQPVEHSTAASVAAALDALTAAAGSGARIDDVAVAYRTVAERRAIVSQLSSASWRSSSLVSTKTALLALLADLPGLAEDDTLLVMEVVGYHTSYLVAAPNREEILLSGSWSSGVVDAETAGSAADRIRPALEAAGVLPDAVVLCGSSAGDPEVVSALRAGLDAPVVTAPDHANAAAYGAALVVAAPFRGAAAEPAAADRKHGGRVILAGAAVAALLGGAAIAVAQARDDRPADAEIGGPAAATATQPVDPNPAQAAPAPAVEQAPISVVPEAAATPEPYPEPPVPPPPANAHAQLPAPPIPMPPGPPPAEQQPPPHPRTSTEYPEPTTAAVPDDTFLFPGESPPPPWNADPAVVQAWWDNHAKLKESWLSGR